MENMNHCHVLFCFFLSRSKGGLTQVIKFFLISLPENYVQL